MRPLVPLLGLIVALCAPGSQARCQPLTEGVRAAALGGAATALPGEALGRSNPAAPATVTALHVAMGASQAYGLPELRSAAFDVAAPLLGTAVRAGIRSFGFEQYREVVLSAGSARSFFSGRIYAGVLVGYHRLSITGYGRARAVDLSVGVIAPVGSTGALGLRAANLNGGGYVEEDELPRTLALGATYQPEAQIRTLLDVRKTLGVALSLRVGVEYRPVPELSIRAGVATEPRRFSTGAGIHVRSLTIDMAAIRHEMLGWTPALEIGFAW